MKDFQRRALPRALSACFTLFGISSILSNVQLHISMSDVFKGLLRFILVRGGNFEGFTSDFLEYSKSNQILNIVA